MKTIILKTRSLTEDEADIKTAADILKRGGIVVIPTETVYGLAADAFDPDAVRRVFEAKGRPADNPLIIHISEFSQIYGIAASVPESAKKLADAFWPGPLTMILPKRAEVPDVTSGGLDTVAVRMPSHPVANKIISLSCPLAAPSANISGFPSPTRFEYAADDMTGRVDAICDGGDCDVGVESTVVTLCSDVPVILRPGGVTKEMLEGVLGEVRVADAVLNPMGSGETAASPGMKYKHYSPKAELTVVRGTAEEFALYLERSDCDAALVFEDDLAPGGPITMVKRDVKFVTFGSSGDPASQARRLFDALRELDGAGAKRVLARSPSKKGVGLAVCNRLYRSAGFRFANAVRRPVIGLTGPTGAGKGFVSDYLRTLGCYITDTDLIAREITAKGSPLLPVLAEAFGEDIIKNGELDRRLLASRAFADKESQQKLNAITHPEIMRIAAKRANDALDEGYAAAVIDAPLLFEAGGEKYCDKVVAVVAPRELRIKRVMERDGITREEALRRMGVQHDDEFYTSRADVMVRSFPPYRVEDEIDPYELGIGNAGSR